MIEYILLPALAIIGVAWLMGSFGDDKTTFYNEDGSEGTGSLILKGIAILIGIYGVYSFRKKQNQCSINPKRKRKNMIILIITIIVLGLGIFFSLEKWSSWYFDTHIVPAQQQELKN